MFGYVIFCQAHINAAHIYSSIMHILLLKSGSFLFIWNRYVLLPMAGIWNLNFFAMLMPHLCYSCSFGNLTVILMEYLSVVYILCLLLLSYLISSVHLKKMLANVRCCRAFGQSFSKWRREWSVSGSDSTIHALATFIALLFKKVGAIASNLFTRTHVHDVNGTVLKSVVTLEPTIDLQSHQYIPYIFAGCIPLIIFGIIPALVLCLYPNKYFQNVLLGHCCGPRKRLALGIFVDTMYSGFKDGLNGDRDYRRLYPFSIIILVVILGTVSAFALLPETYFIILLPIVVFLSLCIAHFRPCKTKAMNMSLSFHTMIIGLSALSIALWIQDYVLDARSLEVSKNSKLRQRYHLKARNVYMMTQTPPS